MQPTPKQLEARYYSDLFQPGQQGLRVLVACEYSGIVRNSFLARGHDAWSCDLLPAYFRQNEQQIFSHSNTKFC